MVGLAISSRPLNTPLRIQSVQFASDPCSNTPRKQFNNLSMGFFEARHARKYTKFIEHASTRSTQARKARQAREHVKHVRTPST